MRRADGINIVQFPLRLPVDLKKQLVVAAETNRRSVNSELISIIERAFKPAVLEGQG